VNPAFKAGFSCLMSADSFFSGLHGGMFQAWLGSGVEHD